MSKILIAKDAAEKAFCTELSRTESQSRHAWKLAAGILIAIGFQLREVKSMVESPSHLVRILCSVSLGILAVGLVFAFQSFQAGGYVNYPRGTKLWENLKPENISPEAAEEAVVQMLLQTREQNARLNDTRGRTLAWCGWLFCAGAVLVAGSQLLEAIADWT